MRASTCAARSTADARLIVQPGRLAVLVDQLDARGLAVRHLVLEAPAPGYVTIHATSALELEAVGLLLVGERHAANGSGPAFSGDGPSARRLADLLGAPVLDVAATANLADGTWDPAAARAHARLLAETWEGRIVACGRRAAGSFGLDEFLVWRGRLGAIPHPSGRCRYWNDPAYVAAARGFLAVARGQREVAQKGP